MSSDLTEELNKAPEKRHSKAIRSFLVERAKEWFISQGVFQDPQGMMRLEDGSIANIMRLKRQYTLDSANFRDVKKGYTELSLSLAFDEAVDSLADGTFKELKQALVFDPRLKESGLEELTKWFRGTCGTFDEVDFAVILHWLWQVKRKLFSKSVTYHMMPVFTGIQGTGKSTSIGKLLEPLKSLSLEGKPVSFVTEEKHYPALGKSFVLFFDEMSKAATTDIDRLKQIITANSLDYRPMYTNATIKVVQNCTFIGAANKDIRDLIRDNTGMRRFYQIAVDSQKLFRNQEVLRSCINSTDALLIWKSIDEQQSKPDIIKHLSAIEERQESIRPLSSIEEFLDDSELRPGTVLKPLGELYEQYKFFCSATGRKDVVMASTFSRELLQRGFEKSRKSSGTFFKIDSTGKLMNIGKLESV